MSAAISARRAPTSSDPDLGRVSKTAFLRYVDFLERKDIPLLVIAHGNGRAAGDFARFCLEQGIDAHLIEFDERLLLRREGHLNRLGNQLLAGYVRHALARASIPDLYTGE